MLSSNIINGKISNNRLYCIDKILTAQKIFDIDLINP